MPSVTHMTLSSSITWARRGSLVGIIEIFANPAEDVPNRDVVIPQPIVRKYGTHLSGVSTLNAIVH